MRRAIAALMILFIMAVSVGAYADEALASVEAYVITNGIKVFASPSTSSKTVGKLSYGESLTVLKKSGDWVKVQNDSNDVGFCKASNLSVDNPNKYSETLYSKKDSTPVYRHTSTSSKTLTQLNKNAEVKAVAITPNGGWCRIKISGGYGYVRSNKLTKNITDIAKEAYVLSKINNVYETSSTNSELLCKVSFGEMVKCVKVDGSWVKIVTESGKTGWCLSPKLSTTDPNGDPVTCYVNVKSLNIRIRPLTGSKVLETLSDGEELSVVAVSEDNTWARIQLDDGYGYVQTSKIEKVKSDGNDPDDPDTPTYDDPYKGTASVLIEKIVALAIQQYGKEYEYAHDGPDTYDCSGLTCYVYSKVAGITLERSAYNQGYDTRFTKISKASELKRGDLVFFNTSDDDDLSDHAGLYIGGGLFIHASSAAASVIVSTLSEGYYSRAFSWGHRVVK